LNRTNRNNLASFTDSRLIDHSHLPSYRREPGRYPGSLDLQNLQAKLAPKQ